MKKIVRLFLTAVFFFTASFSFGQDLTGIWRGYFITDNGDQYRYEVQLDHSPKKGISGVTYSYLDTRFYGKATFVGNYTKNSAAALVQETKTIELKMAGGSVACIMKCRLLYTKSGKEEFLDGIYTSTYEKSDPEFGVRKGGNCGGGEVHLRKVPTSDFYVEPFLRAKKKNEPNPKTDTAAVTARKPAPKKRSTTRNGSVKPAPQKDVARTPIQKPIDVQPQEKKPDITTGTKPIEPKIPSTPLTIRDRKNELVRTITVHNNEIQISLYDNGEIDDDTVSIYLDANAVLANKRLSSKPVTYTLHLDESNPEHTLAMVAENLGRIPPNTSLMIVQDGDKRYEVSISSTMQRNAMVRFRYSKSD